MVYSAPGPGDYRLPSDFGHYISKKEVQNPQKIHTQEAP